MSPLLEVRSITKSFGPTRALDGVSLTLMAGEIHALIGENGAGKSTLMKILAGVHQMDAGEMELEGNAFAPRTPEEARQSGIGTVFQELSLCNNLTVAENIFANREPGSFGLVNYRLLNKLTRDFLADFQFSIPADTPVGDLNLAQKQIIEILKAMALHARVLILDEPTSALEHKDVDRLFDLLARLKEEGAGIIFISHKLDEVFRIADRITVFRDGSRVATLRKEETTRERVIEHMVGREIHQIYPERTGSIGKRRLKVSDFCLQAVFDDITFDVFEGEILGIAGLTGSGRSEVMQSIFAYRRKDAGTVGLEEFPVNLDTPARAIGHGIVYSPEDRKEQGLFLAHSVAMNVTSACLEECSTSVLLSKSKETDIASRMVKDLAIKVSSLEQEVGSLSGGNQQKILLAKCLACRPKVLIVDEPTRGIDIGSKIEIYNLLRKFAGDGGSVILISSELPEIIGLSDRVLVFKEGRIVGEVKSNLTEQTLMQLMFHERSAH